MGVWVRKIVITAIMLLLVSGAFANGIEERILASEKRMVDLEASLNADLAPGTIKDAGKLIKKARKAFGKAKEEAVIVATLDEFDASCVLIIETIEKALETFETLLEARSDCNLVRGQDYDESSYKDAAKALSKAITFLESSKLDKVSEKAVEAETLYRTAELVAIKDQILREAWDTISKADDQKVEEVAPSTLGLAKKYVADAEQILDSDRYDKENAANVAAIATYKARHATYFFMRTNALAGEANWYEKEISQIENRIDLLAKLLNREIFYDRGLVKPIADLSGVLESYQDSLNNSNLALLTELSARDYHIDSLYQKIESDSLEYAEYRDYHASEMERWRIERLEIVELKLVEDFQTLFADSIVSIDYDLRDMRFALHGLQNVLLDTSVNLDSVKYLTTFSTILSEFPEKEILIAVQPFDSVGYARVDSFSIHLRDYLIALEPSLTVERFEIENFGEVPIDTTLIDSSVVDTTSLETALIDTTILAEDSLSIVEEESAVLLVDSLLITEEDSLDLASDSLAVAVVDTTTLEEPSVEPLITEAVEMLVSEGEILEEVLEDPVAKIAELILPDCAITIYIKDVRSLDTIIVTTSDVTENSNLNMNTKP
jgi:hypothetical protein